MVFSQYGNYFFKAETVFCKGVIALKRNYVIPPNDKSNGYSTFAI